MKVGRAISYVNIEIVELLDKLVGLNGNKSIEGNVNCPAS